MPTRTVLGKGTSMCGPSGAGIVTGCAQYTQNASTGNTVPTGLLSTDTVLDPNITLYLLNKSVMATPAFGGAGMCGIIVPQSWFCWAIRLPSPNVFNVNLC